MKKAGLIDMDGTLIDSEKVYQRFWLEAFHHFGYPATHEDTMALRSLARDKAAELLRERFGESLDYHAVHAKRVELMDEYLKDHPYDVKKGVVEGLRGLKAKGIKLCVVTATPREKARKTLGDCGLSEYLDDIVSAKDVEHGKPAPDVYLRALSVMGVSADEAFAIEDAPNGIAAAVAAGIDVYYAKDTELEEEFPKSVSKAVLGSFDEILRYV